MLTLHPCIVYLSLSYTNHSINGLTTSYDIKSFIYRVTHTIFQIVEVLCKSHFIQIPIIARAYFCTMILLAYVTFYVTLRQSISGTPECLNV